MEKYFDFSLPSVFIGLLFQEIRVGQFGLFPKMSFSCISGLPTLCSFRWKAALLRSLGWSWETLEKPGRKARIIGLEGFGGNQRFRWYFFLASYRRGKINDSYLHRQKATNDKVIEDYNMRSKKSSGSLIHRFLLRFKLYGAIKCIQTMHGQL